MNIYLIRAGSKGAIKIGVAKDVDKRIDQLQTGNHQELELIYSCDLGSEKKAFNIESQLHSIYKHHNIRGEWFKPYIDFSLCSKVGLILPENPLHKRRDMQLKRNADIKRSRRNASK